MAEMVKLKIESVLFKELIKAGSITMADVEVIQIEPNDFDYSTDTKWLEAKSDSSKAYRKLKEIEFNIRKL